MRLEIKGRMKTFYCIILWGVFSIFTKDMLREWEGERERKKEEGREREGEKERKRKRHINVREIHPSVALCTQPNQPGPKTQPRHVPQPGLELAIFRSTGGRATPARLLCTL